MANENEADWRLQGQERYLTRAQLVRRTYRRSRTSVDWDHDHCEFCGTKFMVEDVPDVLHEGYCTLDEYRWICERCFGHFRAQFLWEVVDPPA
jgi:hypothetical protein